MIRQRFYLPLALVFLITSVPPTMAAAQGKVVLVPFELHDDMRSGPGDSPDPAEVARVAALSARIRQAFEKSTRYKLIGGPKVDNAIKQVHAGQKYIHRCGSCIVAIGKRTGAQYVAVGWVQRVSNLITNFNLRIVDVAKDKVADQSSIAIRGNDKLSWKAGGKYLLQNLSKGL